MHRIFRVKAYEQEHGPHFDEVMAHKAVSKMENRRSSQFQKIDPLLLIIILD